MLTHFTRPIIDLLEWTPPNLGLVSPYNIFRPSLQKYLCSKMADEGKIFSQEESASISKSVISRRLIAAALNIIATILIVRIIYLI